MVQTPIYLDNHATTRVDPRVVEAMLPYFDQTFGNPSSASHAFGWDAKAAVDDARKTIAHAVGAKEKEILFTSGATESNNLAIYGVVQRPECTKRHLVTVATEHPSVLAPFTRLQRAGYDVTYLPVKQAGDPLAGVIEPQQVADAIRDDTALVSVMLANHEIGTIQPMAEIGAICQERGVLLHCDATQAVGKIPVDVMALQVDLMSFSGHKLFGPKGVGVLFRRRRAPQLRLWPQVEGGGQEGGTRSGTYNVPAIIGMAHAVQLCIDEMPNEAQRLATLRNQLFEGLVQNIPEIHLCGPKLDQPETRLPGNLNVSVAGIDSDSLMISMRDLAISGGSACTATQPGPSHVLQALGFSDTEARGSLRFGLGRFNTSEEIEFAIQTIAATVQRLRKLGA